MTKISGYELDVQTVVSLGLCYIENEKNYGNCPECGGNLIKKTAK